MTGDERDRILGLLSAGPATVGRLAAGLGLPGGVVSYQLTVLEREGLVRVGTRRVERGVPTEVWVGTAAAAPPPLPIPAPLPGLTWIGESPYPAPVWTAPRPAGSPAAGAGHPAAGDPAATAEPAGDRTGAGVPPGVEADRPTGPAQATGRTQPAGPAQPIGPTQPTGHDGLAAEDRRIGAGSRTGDTSPTAAAPGTAPGWAATTSPAAARAPQPRRPSRPAAGPGGGPRFFDVRRVPIDDATFYEFASRLDALAREFAARATPGAPATELTIGLTRPAGDGTAGHGS